MTSDIRWSRTYIWLIDYLLPLPLTALMYWLWEARTGSEMFAIFTLSLGICFGYVVPGICTNLLGLWRFNGPLKIGNYFLHHGFMYAPYLSLTLFITIGEWDIRGPVQAATIVVSSAFVQGMFSTLHDIHGIKAGSIEIFNARAAAGCSPEAVVLESGPLGFGLMGGAYAAICLYFRDELIAGVNMGTFALMVIGGVLIMGLAAVPYVIKERRFIGAALQASQKRSSANHRNF